MPQINIAITNSSDKKERIFLFDALYSFDADNFNFPNGVSVSIEPGSMSYEKLLKSLIEMPVYVFFESKDCLDISERHISGVVYSGGPNYISNVREGECIINRYTVFVITVKKKSRFELSISPLTDVSQSKKHGNYRPLIT